MFFQRTTLCDVGLHVQLGHAPGEHCSTSERGHKDFVTIHTNGIHLVAIDFCRCHGLLHHKQLLRIAWWPGTPINPKMCATMECLRQFHLLNLKANITAFGYYGSLLHMTDNLGLERIPVSTLPLILHNHNADISVQDRLPVFTLMVREFRHTKMLKRSGRAYDPGGVSSTRPGSLAIPCRACPLPNINLPHGWEDVPPEKSYVTFELVPTIC